MISKWKFSFFPLSSPTRHIQPNANKYLEKYKIGLGKYILRSTPTLNPPMHKVNYFLWRHCLIIGFDIIILNSGWLNTSAIKVSVCLRLITKSGLFVWPLTSFDCHQITKKTAKERLSCPFLLHQYQPLNIYEEKSNRQNHILGDKLFWDEHREQLLQIFGQNFRDRLFTHALVTFLPTVMPEFCRLL